MTDPRIRTEFVDGRLFVIGKMDEPNPTPAPDEATPEEVAEMETLTKKSYAEAFPHPAPRSFEELLAVLTDTDWSEDDSGYDAAYDAVVAKYEEDAKTARENRALDWHAKYKHKHEELAALQEKYEEVATSLDKQRRLYIEKVQQHVDALQRHARLREWTKRHGVHQGDCPAWHPVGNAPNDQPCDCGLRAALEDSP